MATTTTIAPPDWLGVGSMKRLPTVPDDDHDRHPLPPSSYLGLGADSPVLLTQDTPRVARPRFKSEDSQQDRRPLITTSVRSEQQAPLRRSDTRDDVGEEGPCQDEVVVIDGATLTKDLSGGSFLTQATYPESLLGEGDGGGLEEMGQRDGLLWSRDVVVSTGIYSLLSLTYITFDGRSSCIRIVFCIFFLV
jgi:hypothetical protein